MRAQIICTTDAYTASRNAHFAHNSTTYVVDEFASLKEANKALLSMFNDLKDGARLPNWGLAAAYESEEQALYACKTYSDGTRAFCHDVYSYSTVLIDE
jgi:hypothetical protein